MGLFHSKKGMSQLIVVVIVALVAVGVYGLATGWFTGEGSSLSVNEDTLTNQGSVAGVCQVEDTSLSGLLRQQYNPTLSLDAAPTYTLVNGEVQAGLPATVSPGDKIKIMWENATGYGKISEEITVPCRGTYDVTERSPYINATALNMKLFNENGDLVTNSAVGTTNITIDSGSSQVVDLKITAASEEGHTDGLVLVEYPTAKHGGSDVVVNLGGSKVSCPSWYTVSATTQAVSCYTVAPILDGASKTGTVTIKAKAGQNPAQGDSYRFIYMTKDVYYDDNANEFGFGFEDEDGTQITPVAQVYQFGII